MKKIILFLIAFIFLTNVVFAKKKENSTLILSEIDPSGFYQYDYKIQTQDTFKLGDKIYYMIYNPDGFKSNYIKIQIVKQDDKTNVLGYSRIVNKTIRVKNKNYYSSYFILNEKGKYFLQIFDITNLQEWLAIGFFRIVDNE